MYLLNNPKVNYKMSTRRTRKQNEYIYTPTNKKKEKGNNHFDNNTK
jgi:hypothetical protein